MHRPSFRLTFKTGGVRCQSGILGKKNWKMDNHKALFILYVMYAFNNCADIDARRSSWSG